MVNCIAARAIARAEACRREQTKVNPTIRALTFGAELGVYVPVYEFLVNGKLVIEDSVIREIGNGKISKASKGR